MIIYNQLSTSEFGGYEELMMMAFTLNKQIHVFKKQTDRYELHAKITTNYLSENEHISLLFSMDTRNSSGHYDLLVIRK